ncbi:hypothetical protein BB558_005900 [Smittium angustum]|uniref:Uncharacterized protein n=1 Tax=Smittium angustum TaxID=133377 RepID=A0A2U1IZ57_SMIAN|nr:hypothetical protein BB558_005900 [Smittium angustum]
MSSKLALFLPTSKPGLIHKLRNLRNNESGYDSLQYNVFMTTTPMIDELIYSLYLAGHSSRYYMFDEPVMIELMHYNMRSRARNRIVDISNRTGFKVNSIKRQFENCRRIFKFIHMCGSNEPEKRVMEEFQLPMVLAKHYVNIIFLCENKFEIEKKSLLVYKFSDFDYCASVLIENYTFIETMGKSFSSQNPANSQLSTVLGASNNQQSSGGNRINYIFNGEMDEIFDEKLINLARLLAQIIENRDKYDVFVKLIMAKVGAEPKTQQSIKDNNPIMQLRAKLGIHNTINFKFEKHNDSLSKVNSQSESESKIPSTPPQLSIPLQNFEQKLELFTSSNTDSKNQSPLLNYNAGDSKSLGKLPVLTITPSKESKSNPETNINSSNVEQNNNVTFSPKDVDTQNEPEVIEPLSPNTNPSDSVYPVLRDSFAGSLNSQFVPSTNTSHIFISNNIGNSTSGLAKNGISQTHFRLLMKNVFLVVIMLDNRKKRRHIFFHVVDKILPLLSAAGLTCLDFENLMDISTTVLVQNYDTLVGNQTGINEQFKAVTNNEITSSISPLKNSISVLLLGVKAIVTRLYNSQNNHKSIS